MDDYFCPRLLKPFRYGSGGQSFRYGPGQVFYSLGVKLIEFWTGFWGSVL